MRDRERIERICNKLKEAWSKVPDQRFGQFISNYIFSDYRERDMFFPEDDRTEENIDKLLKNNEE